MLKRGRYLPPKIQSSRHKYVPRTFTTLKAGIIFKKTCSALLTSKIKQKFCRMVRQNSGDDDDNDDDGDSDGNDDHDDDDDDNGGVDCNCDINDDDDALFWLKF